MSFALDIKTENVHVRRKGSMYIYILLAISIQTKQMFTIRPSPSLSSIAKQKSLHKQDAP